MDWKYEFGPDIIKLALVWLSSTVVPTSLSWHWWEYLPICLSWLLWGAFCQIPENIPTPVTFWGWTNDLLGLRWGQFIFCLQEWNVIIIKSEMHLNNALIIPSLLLVALQFDMIEKWVRRKPIYTDRHNTTALCWLLISLQHESSNPLNFTFPPCLGLGFRHLFHVLAVFWSPCGRHLWTPLFPQELSEIV